MSDNYDGNVVCPNCETRNQGPKPSAESKLHHYACTKCKTVFVVQDIVQHQFVTDFPAPFPLGQKFRRDDGDTIYQALKLWLTECQGWWVHGVAPGGYTNMACKDVILL